MRNELRREGKIALRTDKQIEKAIKDAFLYDPRGYAFSPKVDTGEVVLRGSVGNLKAKKAAEQDAENTIGAWRVLNYLRCAH